MGRLAATSKRLAGVLLAIGGNRLELLILAVQEGRAFVLRAILLALGMAVFGLLATMAFTAAIVVLGWAYSPVAVLMLVAVLHGAAGFALYRRLERLVHEEQSLSALLDQLRKDRAALEQALL